MQKYRIELRVCEKAQGSWAMLAESTYEDYDADRVSDLWNQLKAIYEKEVNGATHTERRLSA